MYVDDSRKLLYVHIPKTAGALVYRLMLPDVKTIGSSHDHLDEDTFLSYKEYKKFTIVRNSYELFASSYRFSVLKFGYNKSFSRYIDETYLNKRQLKYFVHPQYGNMLNLIIHYPDRVTELKKLFNVTELPKGEDTHYYGEYNWREYYTKETQEKVRAYCSEDIEYFGWRFK